MFPPGCSWGKKMPDARITEKEATERQIAAIRKLYGGRPRLDVPKWAEYAVELDHIIDDLLGRTNPYFSDE